MKVLVTGATGNVGKQILPRLLERGHAVRVLTRSPHKLKDLKNRVEVVEGSLATKEPLAEACEKVDSMFLLTPLEVDEVAEGTAGVAAAKAAKVGRVVYMAVYRVEEGRHIPHFGTKIPVKEALRDSGLDHVFIEPNNFFQTDLWNEDPIRLFSVYPQPFGDLGVSRVDTRDIADAAVNALTGAGSNGSAYPIVGPDILNGEDCARVWGQHLGREVQYIGNDLDNWEKQAEMMMPPGLAHDLRIMYEFFHKEGFRATGEDLARCERILGHSPRRFSDFVAEVAATWK